MTRNELSDRLYELAETNPDFKILSLDRQGEFINALVNDIVAKMCNAEFKALPRDKQDEIMAILSEDVLEKMEELSSDWKDPIWDDEEKERDDLAFDRDERELDDFLTEEQCDERVPLACAWRDHGKLPSS